MTMTETPTERRKRRKAKHRVRPTAAELAATYGGQLFDAQGEPTPAARWSDPPTSHLAAERAKALGPKLVAVWECLAECGPMTDVELVTAYAIGVHSGRWPKQAASGLRTRRCELGDLSPPFVVPTGETRPLPSGGRGQVWAAVRPPEATP